MSHRSALALAFFVGVTVVPATSAIEGCQPAKAVTKGFFDLADAACLTGLLDRTDLTDEQKIDICGIESALSNIAHTFLVKQRSVVEARVAAQVSARGALPCADRPDGGK